MKRDERAIVEFTMRALSFRRSNGGKKGEHKALAKVTRTMTEKELKKWKEAGAEREQKTRQLHARPHRKAEKGFSGKMCRWMSNKEVDIAEDESVSRLMDKVKMNGNVPGDWFLTITQVVDGSPAAKCGIQAGDYLLSVDGHTAIHPINVTTSGSRFIICKKRNPSKAQVMILESDRAFSGMKFTPSKRVAIQWIEGIKREQTNVLGWTIHDLLQHLCVLGEYDQVLRVTKAELGLYREQPSMSGCTLLPLIAILKKNESLRSPMLVHHGVAMIEKGHLLVGKTILSHYISKYSRKFDRKYYTLAQVYMLRVKFLLDGESPSLEEATSLFYSDEATRVALEQTLPMFPNQSRPDDLFLDTLSEKYKHPLLGSQVEPYEYPVFGSPLETVALNDHVGNSNKGKLLLIIFLGGSKASSEYARILELLAAYRDVLLPDFVSAVHILQSKDNATRQAVEELAYRQNIPVKFLQPTPAELKMWEEKMIDGACGGIGAMLDEQARKHVFDQLPFMLWVNSEGYVSAVKDFSEVLRVLAEENGHANHSTLAGNNSKPGSGASVRSSHSNPIAAFQPAMSLFI